MPDDTVLLEHHFDTAFAAADGIQKLRELILTLAMQGKLVPQDSKDQPASELLKEIEAEKKQLIKEGKIKQPKPSPEIEPEELLYQVPKEWVWVRIPNCYYGIGAKINQIQTKEYLESGIYPVIDQGKAFIAGYFNDASRLLEITKPVIIFGDHTKNIKFIDFNFVIGADGVKILCPYKSILARYLYQVILSYKLTDRGYARHFKVLNEKLVPLPPLAEQHRIVAKIDRLMARCDELEKLRSDRNQKRITIHTAALDRLLNAKENSDFSTAWRFITQHFGELYSVKGNVAELRKAILQLAVMGKLVPQDPTDEPASELLKAIAAEKQQLVKEGKIKQPKPLPEIKPKDIAYELYKEWEWVRLGTITNVVRGGSPRPAGDPQFYDGDIPFLKVADLTATNEMYLTTYTYSIKEAGLHKTRMVSPDTLLLTNSGATLGIPKICTFETTFNDGIAAFIFMNEGLYKPFLYYFLASKTKYFLEEASRGQGQPNLNIEIIGETFVALPPFSEQQRIVTKIDQLMALCDELDQQIDAATSKQSALLNAVMAQV